MGTHSDGLLDELLFRIALTSDKGTVLYYCLI